MPTADEATDTATKVVKAVSHFVTSNAGDNGFVFIDTSPADGTEQIGADTATCTENTNLITKWSSSPTDPKALYNYVIQMDGGEFLGTYNAWGTRKWLISPLPFMTGPTALIGMQYTLTNLIRAIIDPADIPNFDGYLITTVTGGNYKI